MAQALPIHIISEIERRWQRRMDSPPQADRGKKDDYGAGLCPHCGAAVASEAANSGDTVAHCGRVCRSCGRAWNDASK